MPFSPSASTGKFLSTSNLFGDHDPPITVELDSVLTNDVDINTLNYSSINSNLEQQNQVNSNNTVTSNRQREDDNVQQLQAVTNTNTNYRLICY